MLPAALAPAIVRSGRVALIRPLLLAGRDKVHKGVMREEAIHAAVRDAIRRRMRGFDRALEGLIPSPVPGGDGNRQFPISERRP
jgi:23S rRNA (cytidine1920-2'-O)/16S rRNA (cytidine1409-2'-O)-methyltransferase